MAEMHDTTEEYLESILAIEEEGVVPMRARLVERLGLSAAAVSETIGRLSDHGYVELHGDRSLHLTDKGRRLATTVVRRHRLAERLLVDVIGLEWEKVHREADRWEHAISSDVEEKLVLLLGDPATCPHGNPIPGSKHHANGAPTFALARSDPGRVVVRRVNERLEIDDDGIRQLAAARMMPGCEATVVENIDGTVTIDTETGQHTLPRRVAENLFVSVP
jgi:DtxR family transcriptional regulator, Mn-dependent transcriptional regulator